MAYFKNINIFLNGLWFYLITIIISYALFWENMLQGLWLLGQSIIILYFFIGVRLIYRTTISFTPDKFIKTIISLNIIIKSGALLFSFFYYKSIFGIGIIDYSDYYSYYSNSLYFSEHLGDFFRLTDGISLSDLGAFIYYTIIYFIFGDILLISSIINMIFAIHSIILFYKTIKLINTEVIAKITATVMSLIPILNYNIGLHLKETFFIWLILMGTYYTFKVFAKTDFTYRYVLIITFSIISLFFFRTVVGIIFIASFSSYLLFSKSIKLSLYYKIFIITIQLSAVLLLYIWSTVSEETTKYYEASDNENTIMEIGVENTQRNKSAVKSFMSLPSKLIMSINSPYPNLINYNLTERESIIRYNQIADSFIKGFLAFFFFLSLVDISFLRKNIFISSFILMYLIVLGMGGASLLYRMFLPILPFFIYFSVVQITKMTKTKYLILFGYLAVMIFIYLYFNYMKIIDFNL